MLEKIVMSEEDWISVTWPLRGHPQMIVALLNRQSHIHRIIVAMCEFVGLR